MKQLNLKSERQKTLLLLNVTFRRIPSTQSECMIKRVDCENVPRIVNIRLLDLTIKFEYELENMISQFRWMPIMRRFWTTYKNTHKRREKHSHSHTSSSTDEF